MLTNEQLEWIDGLLQTGYTLEQIAKKMSITRSQLYLKLLKQGKEVVIKRYLGNVGESMTVENFEQERELAAA